MTKEDIILSIAVLVGLGVAYMIGLVDGYRGQERKRFGEKKKEK